MTSKLPGGAAGEQRGIVEERPERGVSSSWLLSPGQAARAHLAVACALLAAVGIQISMVYVGAPIPIHRDFGVLIALLALTLTPLALLARFSRAAVVLSFLLLPALLLQLLLILLVGILPALNGLHGLNAFLILLLAVLVAIESDDQRKKRRAVSEIRSPGAPSSPL